jgi:hypothetical protein
MSDERDETAEQHDAAEQPDVGELRCGTLRWRIYGRTLRLMLWLAARQQQINTVAAQSGQLWITWKGDGPRSIDGEVKTRLLGE